MSAPRSIYHTPIVIDGKQFEPMIFSEEIAEAVSSMAAELSERYRGQEPVLVCVLNGAALFHADLVRGMPIPVLLDYIRVSSYGAGMQSGEDVLVTAGGTLEITGRPVIIVEDIVDTGRTAEYLRQHYLKHGATSVEIAALLYKPEAHVVGIPPEYTGFEIPNRFVIGFGLDFNRQGRNLPIIYMLSENL